MKDKRKLYSAMVVMDPHLTETRQIDEGNKVKRQIIDFGGEEVCDPIQMGALPLAYNFKNPKRTTGVFNRYFFKVDASRITPLHNSIKMNEAVIRLMVVEESSHEPKKLAEKVIGNEKK